jgi:hypothetical protein
MSTILNMDPRRNKLCRVHVYFGQVCKAEVVDNTKEFDENVSSILASFGLEKEQQNDY